MKQGIVDCGLDLFIPLYIIWYMNTGTKTILNIKTDKKLKKSAQKTAEELGIPLSTAINAFLKQFVREKEITLSANKLQPTPYLQRVIKEAEKEFAEGKTSEPFSGDELIRHLKKL
jgi:addiction module RelB/DinJ family antitoxin